MFIEYCPMHTEDVEAGACPISWGPIKIVQNLQRTVHIPLVLVLPPLEPHFGMSDGALRKAKKAYMRTARELAAMCRALGVPFVPLTVHLVEIDGTMLKGPRFSPEPLWSRYGDSSRELQKRISDRLLGVADALSQVMLTKDEWNEAIDKA